MPCPHVFPVHAITFDLDDTLWPFAPIGARVEQVLHDWLAQNCPRTAQCFPLMRMRELRDELNARHPHMAHDYSAMRRLTLGRGRRGRWIRGSGAVRSSKELYPAPAPVLIAIPKELMDAIPERGSLSATAKS